MYRYLSYLPRSTRGIINKRMTVVHRCIRTPNIAHLLSYYDVSLLSFLDTKIDFVVILAILVDEDLLPVSILFFLEQIQSISGTTYKVPVPVVLDKLEDSNRCILRTLHK